MLRDFLNLTYPHLCIACNKPLYIYEKLICTYCKYHLPKTNFHFEEDNPVSRQFWGKANIFSATAYYYFSKGGKVQQLLHNLKYNGKKEVGVEVGNMFGRELKESSLFNTVNCVIPVPLHPSKKKKRGYNQSDFIADGIATGMNVSSEKEILIRAKATSTQTKKSAFERWLSVESIFKIKNENKISGKHILLVDDVITTGSTFESCAAALLSVPGTKVSIAAIAVAKK